MVKSTFFSDDAGWGRLASYYKPHSIVVLMVILAAIASFGMPVVSYIIIHLQWAYYSSEETPPNPDWEKDSHTLMIVQVCWTITVLIVTGAEKALFAVMGEKLTLKLRLMLIEEILHK